MNIFKRLFKDKHGAALVYVIVAAAVIIILGAATTAVAYVNLQATRIQAKSENNFYSADSVMNAVVGGLENDVSQAYDKAYTTIITQYGDTSINTEEVKEEFKSIFVEELKRILNDSSQPNDDAYSGFYSISHIQDYVQGTFPDNISYTISAVGGNNFIDFTNNYGVILRNLHVTYEDDNGYYDEITTDVKIVPPDIGTISDIEINAPVDILLVADDGLEADVRSNIYMNGNIYLGAYEVYPGHPELNGNVILLREHSIVEIASPMETIAGGDVLIKNFANLSMQSTDESSDGVPTALFWIGNMSILREAKYSMSGHLQVLDDLEVNGSNSKVTLAGEYYGFSKGIGTKDEQHNQSSAININGTNTELDFRDLKILVIAGASYIRTTSVDSTLNGTALGENGSDVRMGEGFSVKGNQIAYLVNEKLFAPEQKRDEAGNTRFISNPMNYERFDELKSARFSVGDWKKMILNSPLSKCNNKSYADMGASDVLPIFSNKSGGTVYLYLVFDTSEKAALFFNEITVSDNATSQQLRTYAEQYVSKFMIKTDTKFYMGSNFIRTTVQSWDEDYDTGIISEDGTIIYDRNNIQRIVPISNNDQTNGLGYHVPSDENKKSAIDLADLYASNYEKEITRVTFDSKINEDQLKNIIQMATSAARTDPNTNNTIQLIDNGVIFKGTNGSQAILLNNEGKDAYVVTGNGGNGIIVANGDVVLEGDWVGTIISKHRVYVNVKPGLSSKINFIYEKGPVVAALSVYFSHTEGDIVTYTGPAQVFKGWESTIVNRATQLEGDNANLIKNCITFTNWNKD